MYGVGIGSAERPIEGGAISFRKPGKNEGNHTYRYRNEGEEEEGRYYPHPCANQPWPYARKGR
jgi:hypothetical protein